MDYQHNKRIIILPYKMGSKSAKDLQQELNDKGFRTLRVYPRGNYHVRRNDFIINWGFSGDVRWGSEHIDLNKPNNVGTAINKHATFKALSQNGVRTPEFTTNREETEEWETIYTRANLCSTKGRGIAIFHKGDILPTVPLYVKGIDVKGEYRVHVMNGKVIDYTKKLQQHDVEYTEEQIRVRNHDNGWVFGREGIRRLEDVEEIAIKAIETLGLNFGSVDIVKDQDNVPYVLEVNTASGITGTALSAYTEEILSILNS